MRPGETVSGFVFANEPIRGDALDLFRIVLPDGSSLAVTSLLNLSPGDTVAGETFSFVSIPIPVGTTLGAGFVEAVGRDVTGLAARDTEPFFIVNLPPNPPDPILVNGLSADGRLHCSRDIVVSWTFSDSDVGDTQTAYQVQISTGPLFAPAEIVLDSGKILSTANTAAFALPFDDTFFVRVRTWDLADETGAFTIGGDSFSVDSTPPAFLLSAAPNFLAACETSVLSIQASEPLAALPTVGAADSSGQPIALTLLSGAAGGTSFAYLVGPVADTHVSGSARISVSGADTPCGHLGAALNTQGLFLQVSPFAINLNPPQPGRINPNYADDGGTEPVRIGYEIPAPAVVTVVETDAAGNVRVLLPPTLQSPGVHMVIWDGLDAAGGPAPAPAATIGISAVAVCGGSVLAETTVTVTGAAIPALVNFNLSPGVANAADSFTLSYTIFNQAGGPVPRDFQTTLTILDLSGAAVFTTILADSGNNNGIANTHVVSAALLAPDAPYLFQVQSVRVPPPGGPLANRTTNARAAVGVVVQNDTFLAMDTGTPTTVLVRSDTSSISITPATFPTAGAPFLRSVGGFLSSGVFRITPAATPLGSPAVVEFRCASDQFPEKLGLFRIRPDGTLEEIPTLADPSTCRLFARMDSFSLFALLAPAVTDRTPPTVTAGSVAPSVFSPNEDGRFDFTEIRWDARDDRVRTLPRAEVEVRNAADRTLAHLLENAEIPFGPNRILWSGEGDSGFVLPSGRYRFHARVTEIAGNSSEGELGEVILDIDPPVIATDPIPAATQGSVTLGARATDNFTPAAEILLAGDESPYTQEGAYEVTLAATDNVANSSTLVVSFVIDRTPPEISIFSPLGDETFIARTNVVPIRFSVRDNLDPAPQVLAELVDQEEATRVPVFAGQDIEPLSIDDGFWILAVSARDAAGNVTTVSSNPFEVIHDIRPPRTTASVGAPTVDSFVTSASAVTLAAVDDLIEIGDGTGLGVASTEFALDGSAFQIGTFFHFTGADGVHTALFRSTDVVGNQEEDRSLVLHLDNTTPVIETSVGDPQYADTRGLFVTSATPIAFAITDAGAGVAGETLVVVRLSGEGVSSVARNATDRLGNTSAAVTVTAYVDDLAPVSEVSVGAPSFGTYVTSHTPITVTATDGEGAGVAEVFANGQTLAGPILLQGEGDTVLVHHAVDRLDNAEVHRSRAFILDNTPPTTTLGIDVTDTSGTILIRESLVSLTAHDTGSGVGYTEFRLDEGLFDTYAGPFEIGTRVSDTADHTIAFRSFDNLGNAEFTRVFSFRVSPALAVSKTRSLAPRILAWWNGAGEMSEATRATLASGTLLFDTVSTEAAFAASMRTGRYNLFVILGEEENPADRTARELAERVNLGAGVVSVLLDRADGPMLSHDMREGTEDLARRNILGVFVAGLRPSTGEAVRVVLADTPYEVVSADRIERIRENIGETGAVVASDSSLAGTIRTYGRGKAVYLAWDASSETRVLADALGAATPETEPLVAGGVAAVEIRVRSLVTPLDLAVAIEELVPSEVTVLTVTPPAVVSGGALSWTVLLDAGEETAVAYTAEVPSDTATTEATVRYLVRGSYRAFGIFPIALAGSTAPADLAAARDLLAGFVPTLSPVGGDRARGEAALATVERLLAAPPATPEERDQAVADLLEAIEGVLRIREPSVRSVVEETRETLGRALPQYSVLTSP